MKEALFYKNAGSGKLECLLCPHRCTISDGKKGACGVRVNKGGKLYSLNYAKVSSLALDPIEKKPLYRYHPGEFILSAGTVGCNLSCEFCQNWSISKVTDAHVESMAAEELVSQAKRSGSFGIAYTYNEPFIWYEFVYECAVLAKKEGLENVLVTNGYVMPEPLKEILPLIGAMNIDLKSSKDSFYKDVCSASLGPVQDTIRRVQKKCHVELTNLIIPDLNDSKEDITDLVDWVYDNLGSEVPLHLSRYFPNYKMMRPPTPLAVLEKAKEIASKKLKYVYLGNV